MLISRTGTCSNRGFTLLEIIVVIFVLSIVLGLSLPVFIGFGGGSTQSDAKRLGSIIRYLNDSAVSTRSDYQLKIDLGSRHVSYASPEGKRDEEFRTLTGITLQSRGFVSGGEVLLFFGPLGPSEGFTIYLEDGKKAMAVSLNSLSGRVRVAETQAL